MAKILLSTGLAPDTPAAGKIVLYAKSPGVLCWKDDQGTEYCWSGTPTPTTDNDLFASDGDALYTSDGLRLGAA
jgi:hypothetical protein